MNIDLVLEISPQELEEFPEVTGVKEQGTVVPDCGHDSLQTSQDNTENTSQKEEVHTPDPCITAHSPRRNSPGRNFKGNTTPSNQREPLVYICDQKICQTQTMVEKEEREQLEERIPKR